MDYEKYYIYKEMVSYDSGQTWRYTGNESPSGDPIGSYDTFEECENDTPHTPTGYNCKFYASYIVGDGETRELIIPCDGNPTLTYSEVKEAIYEEIYTVYGGSFVAELVVIGDCVETVDFRNKYAAHDGYFRAKELVISPTVTKMFGFHIQTWVAHQSIAVLFDSVDTVTLYNTITEFVDCCITVNNAITIEKGFLDNNGAEIFSTKPTSTSGRTTFVVGPGGVFYLSDKLPRYSNIGLKTDVKMVVPDDSVGYYRAVYGCQISGSTGGGTGYRGVVGAIGTKSNGDRVEYYLNEYGILENQKFSNIQSLNIVSPTKGIRNCSYSCEIDISIANSVRIINGLQAITPDADTAVFGEVSLPDNLWWMENAFTTDFLTVDWKKILPLPSGLYLLSDCFWGSHPSSGTDYYVETLTIPNNLIYLIGRFPSSIGTLKLGTRVKIAVIERNVQYTEFNNVLVYTDIVSKVGTLSTYPDSLKYFYAGLQYNTDFAFGPNILRIFIDGLYNNKFYFTGETPPTFSFQLNYGNVIFYVPVGTYEEYYNAAGNLNPEIIEV